jgi:hypothetical protein
MIFLSELYSKWPERQVGPGKIRLLCTRKTYQIPNVKKSSEQEKPGWACC